MRIALNDQWYFTPEFCEELLQGGCLEKMGYQKVRIPHTVSMMEMNYCNEKDYQMVSGYVCERMIPGAWAGRRIVLVFEGAAHEASVYCNGQLICTHSCGYTAFEADVTEAVSFDQVNRFTIRLDSRESLNIPPFGNVIDYMTFGGIYRPVWLDVREPVHFTDVFVRGDMDGLMEVSMEAAGPERCTVKGTLTDMEGNVAAATEEMAYTGFFSLRVNPVRLWSVSDPYLYTLRLELIKNGVVSDYRTVRFGFRTVAFNAEGFFLNGKRIKLRGLNRHQSWPYIGYAAPDRAQRLDADILKNELGCNAVRTSHYPQSQAFIDRCDEIGLLVFTEIPGWQYIGDDAWKETACENVREMVLQYRNHPSIFMWGVRINESPDDDSFYEKTNAIARRLDPTRPTGGVRCIKDSHLLEDVYTYNDFIHSGDNDGCQPKNSVTSDKNHGYMVTEYNGHMFPTKPWDSEEHRTEHALRHARVLSDIGQDKRIAGSFGWCMFDYNTHKDFGSGDRVCYHGVLDMFRNPKTAAFVYASQQRKTPVLEVASSMDIGEHPAGALKTVTVFTNADFVRLYKNDVHVGDYYPDWEHYRGLKRAPVFITDRVGNLLETQEGYTPALAKDIKNCLAAVALYGPEHLPAAVRLRQSWLKTAYHIDEDCMRRLFGKYYGGWGEKQTCWRFEAVRGHKVIATVYKQSVETVILEARADTLSLTDGPTWDMATIRLAARDGFGNLLPYCHRGLTFRTEGAIALVGPEISALAGGYGGCYVRTTGQAGTGKLMIAMEGGSEQTLEFQVEKIN